GTTPKSSETPSEKTTSEPAKPNEAAEKVVATGITRSTMPNQEASEVKSAASNDKKPVNKTRRILLWSMVGLLIILLLSSALVGLPKTSVTLAVQTQPWKESLSLEAG